jgi:hypothetical protein
MGANCGISLLSPTPASLLYNENPARARVEFSGYTYRRVFADEPPGIKELICKYPDIFSWFYRYPCQSFYEKLEIIEAGR